MKIVFNFLSGIAFVVFLICASCLDSEPAGIFYIGCIASVVYLLGYAKVENKNRK